LQKFLGGAAARELFVVTAAAIGCIAVGTAATIRPGTANIRRTAIFVDHHTSTACATGVGITTIRNNYSVAAGPWCGIKNNNTTRTLRSATPTQYFNKY